VEPWPTLLWISPQLADEGLMCRHHDIRPVERDCICLERTSDAPHIAACDSAFRAKFFGAWARVREDFHTEAGEHQMLSALGNQAVMN
jgi:hypothetical protein